MNVAFHSSFNRDLKKIADKTLLERVAAVIRQVGAAAALTSVPGVKPFGGAYFRTRIGD